MTDFQQFIVIRHGESQTNATNTFQAGNQSDSDPLTPLGMEDARRLAERLTALPVDVIVSSSYLRARSTAGAIAEATGASHIVPVWKGSSWVDLPANDPELRNVVSLLREIDVPSELQDWVEMILGPGRYSTPAVGARRPTRRDYSDEENLYDLWRRAEEMRRYLESRTERLIVVVAHGGINKVWLAHLMFTTVAGLDTPTQLAAYGGFTRLGWWDNTGVLSLRLSPKQGWLWLMTDIQHLQPEYFSFMRVHPGGQSPPLMPAPIIRLYRGMPAHRQCRPW